MDRKELLKKENNLLALKKKLKKDFIGIDGVIDSIVDYIGPWYVVPNVMESPLVINLWGTTGVGKTDLVRKLAEYLKKDLLEIDVGEFGHRNEFSDVAFGSFLEYNGKGPIILLDEFQHAKTIMNGDEVDRNYLRGIWRLLSDGTIQINRWVESRRSIIKTLKSIQTFKKEDKDNNNESEHDFFHYRSGSGIRINTKFGEDAYPEYIMETISPIIGLSFDDINHIVQKDPIIGNNKIIKMIQNSQITTEIDFRKSIIFVAGNLDDLYENARNVNPDLDVDFLHDKTKKISIPDTKLILSTYFKPEQISRLGNNHLIYPFLSEKDFKSIISQKIIKSVKMYKVEENVNFVCDDLLKKFIYAEGVYPTQGVRPIKSTIKGIVQTNCQKFIFDAYKDNLNLDGETINISFDIDSSEILFKTKKKTYRYYNDMKISSLRKPKNDDKHTLIAIHEGGHAICYAVAAGLCPSRLTAFSANADSDGFTRVCLHPDKFTNKKQFYGFIVAALGGRAAEIEFFGEENISTGSQNDLKYAAGMATEYIEKHSFLITDPLYTTASSLGEDNFDLPRRRDETEKKFKELIIEALEKAREIVRNNKKVILDLSLEMLKKEFLVEKDIQNILNKNKITISKELSYVDIIAKEAAQYGIEM